MDLFALLARLGSYEVERMRKRNYITILRDETVCDSYVSDFLEGVWASVALS